MKIKNLERFAKGWRGIVYTGFYKGKKVAVKEGRTVKNEWKWLKKLNRYGIGPKIIGFDGRLVYEFVEGERFVDFIKKNNRNKINKIIKVILRKMRKMDKLKINKEEMHNPVKHIFVGKKIKMIDFERCRESEKPKNVTQFCQFLMRKRLVSKRVIKVLKEYKKDYNEKNFKKILEFF